MSEWRGHVLPLNGVNGASGSEAVSTRTVKAIEVVLAALVSRRS